MNQRKTNSNPSALTGYRMPAEWEPHKATWLAWPHDRNTWPAQLDQVKNSFIEIIQALHSGEEVRILVNDGFEAKQVRNSLREVGVKSNVFFHHIRTKSVWIRDYGPMFIAGGRGRRAIAGWKFNAWGGKYPAQVRDSLIPEKIAYFRRLPLLRPKMVLEGGSVDFNGAGTCLTTEECLLNPNRNPRLARVEIEQALKDFLGIKHFIWLVRGIKGDDTDGHIDCVARFVNRNTVVVARETDTSSVNFKAFEQNWKLLQAAIDQAGRKLNIISIPTPGKVMTGRKILPANYANFYIGNRAVLVPVFGVKSDRRVLSILKELFPKRNVAGIDCKALAYGLGAIHCATQQEPKG
jgi:agmatine deiminase